ncbi:ATP-binding protein [Clostridium botulinum]|uniref:IstB-like ATP-binding domain-containing protein n=1 Tax=Clostridium botulinum (strain Okra / Type B1) TaxID=498213 RepID=B1II24_CLOBK|nr:ATP-binding protein [Clostridium botulinum]EKX78757.1 hypothetical protein CFSAN001628_017259 [Clostridium botulinum CFSAN001628]ACA46366.1 conserved hypothetical protein [Clostridium botulinum B1 str. Okra]MBD5564114.1 ATP-binding protein [Clostridium botulinum]MBD5566763.1 ATP-binding protein [Clostridium botulinum]MBD5568721.1 ATP-binding protein [Clostridium botulinum]
MTLKTSIKRIMKEINNQRENGLGINHQNLNCKGIENVRDSYKEVCNKCGGSTWITNIDKEGRVCCRRCSCYEMQRAKDMWNLAGINTEQSKHTFSNYKPYNETTELAKNTAIQYYKNFDKIKNTRRNSIAFIGQVGSGKTHLSIALAVNFLRNKQVPVVYMPYRNTITKIKQNMIDEEYYSKVLSKYQKAKILLIDDLFKGKINESDTNIMFEIINYRYMNYLPMIVSSEFTIERLLDFDEAIGSRIIEMAKDYTVEIVGKENNYRLKI